MSGNASSLAHPESFSPDGAHLRLAQSAPIIFPQGTQMPRHTTMPPRIQKTPHGDVSLTSKWAHEQYYLCASGSLEALKWMFSKLEQAERHTACFRHSFKPAPTPITVERDLRRVCAKWQDHWDGRLADHIDGAEQTPVEQSSDPRTLGELYDHHQAHFVGQVSLQTKYKYPLHMRDWLKELGRDALLADLTAETILAARAKIQRQRKVSDSTMNGRVRTLKKMLNLARRKKWVQHACWEDVPDLREIHPPVQYWTPDHAAKAFAAAAADTEPATATMMLVLGLFLGLRKNEAVNVRWCDLDLDRVNPRTGETSPICRLQQRPGFTTKTYENRIIPVSNEALPLLRAHRPADAKPEDYVLEAQRDAPKRGGTKRVYRYDPVKVWIRVRNAAMAAGAPYIEFKEMRHSFACACLQAGHSAEEVARWLGHSTTQMVHEHYAHLLNYEERPRFNFLGQPPAKGPA
ncbi:MAG TPA: hypothetical protein DCS97_04025 [Planctomycetes bacterium]|nr:hypothetical protein [Planctomycetota bacterium]